MNRYCKACCQVLPDERFSNEGRKAHLCKKCSRLPPSQREAARALDDLSGFVRQKNLSAANITRLKVLAKSEDETVRTRAAVLLEVARVHPHESKRLAYLREKLPDLHDRYVQAFGLTPEPEPPPPATS